MNEHDIKELVQIELSKHGFCTFSENGGGAKLGYGRFFDTGFTIGFSDIFAVKDGKIYFIEVKSESGKPSKEQLDFWSNMFIRYGCMGGIARSVDDALKICGVIK